jgi:N-acetyl-anhydromuramyl-L-alanine amidase AmpD
MPRPLFDSEYIFGIHEPGGEQHMLEAGKPGWIVFTEAIGHDPNNHGGVDFTPFSRRDLGVICRINNGYQPDGTIPHSSLYEQFAQRCANFVAASPGCKIWIIGNEMNYAVERPGSRMLGPRVAQSQDVDEADPFLRGLPERFNALQPEAQADGQATRGSLGVRSVGSGEVITPAMYARCYTLCREAIHRLPGHADDQVLIGAVAPWNTQTTYTTNPTGDWVKYFQDILQTLGPNGCDGITIHTYTHGEDPNLIHDESKLKTFPQYFYNFKAYRDFMNAVPANMRHLPVYITETDQDVPWRNENNGWIRNAYAEINWWNSQPGNQQIRALILYRWPKIDKWYIEGKEGTIGDFRAALQSSYKWSPMPKPKPPVDVTPTQPGGPKYRAQWLKGKLPKPLVAGGEVIVPITVKNIGSMIWPHDGPNPVRLGYHYMQNKERVELPPDREVLTPLPKDVAPGDTVTIDARIALPLKPGNYTLNIDLFHEGKTWFADQNSSVLTRWLTVSPAGEETGDKVPDTTTPLQPVNPPDEPPATITDPSAPWITDISDQLPKGEKPYERRALSQIRYMVINHTGAPPIVPLEVIAQAHVDRDYPGIAYDYFVDKDGNVFQVSRLDEVVKVEADWSGGGVNICLEGNFNESPPSTAQLEGTAKLCAWLAEKLELSPYSIVGLRELLNTSSPGDTFLAGPNWKRTLIERVKDLVESTPESPGGGVSTPPKPAKVPRPTIRDIVTSLPRDPGGFFSRRPEDIQYVVINHTAAPASIPIEVIANAFREKLPGILYQFYIDGEGVIYQTEPLMQAVDGEQPYIANAINIAFAGDFSNDVPTPSQIAAGGQLIAWLMDKFPQLTLDDVRGVSEFIPHGSPGEQWLKGRRWKDMLLTAIVSAQKAGGGEGGADSALVAQLQKQLENLERENRASKQRIQRLEQENQRLRQQIDELEAGSGLVAVRKPPINYIADRLPRHPTLRYDRRSRNAITHIAVHHTAAAPQIGPQRIAELHVSEDPDRGKDAWPGIGYHFFIHADGTIDQTNDLETISYHVFQNNEYSVGVVFAGSFMNGTVPTPAQLRAGAHLIAWLMQELNVPLENVWGHKEFPHNTTVCPGSEWQEGKRWRQQLLQRIGEVRSGLIGKPLQHYLLFWQRPYPGPFAEADLRNAMPYIRRFRPTLGFSVEDAMNAEFVTIVGGDAGISGEDEVRLRQSGSQVERLAGRDEAETAKMLEDLANQGKRFRDLDGS